MAHSLSAQKRMRQTEKRAARNKARKTELKNETKAVTAALAAGDVATAGKALNVLVSTLDRLKTKPTIHKNTAARRRSRLTKRLNTLVAAGGVVAKAAPKGSTKAPAKSAAKSAKKSGTKA